MYPQTMTIKYLYYSTILLPN